MQGVRARWVLGVSMVAAVGALLVALVLGSSTQAEQQAPSTAVRDAHRSKAPTAGLGEEVVSKRTATSRTFRGPDGTLRTLVSLAPINFRDADGDWRAIDTALKPDGHGALSSRKTPSPVTLPTTLERAAKVSDGAHSLSFALQDALPVVAETSGAIATYDDALDGVDASYQALASGVKETLTLTGADAPSTFHFSLDPSAGLHAALQPGGAVVLRDGAGKVRFTIPAPTVKAADEATASTDHVSYRLSEDGRTLTVAVDEQWLAAARFPVEVDPTIYAGGWDSCTLASGTLATTSDCNSQWLKVGHDTGHTYRSVLRFNNADIPVPESAAIISAEVDLVITDQDDTSAVTQIDAIGLDHQITGSATWNSYDGTNAWTSAGGDLVSEPLANANWMVQDYIPGWVGFDVSALAERWIKDPSTNNGVVLKAADEGAENVITFGGQTYVDGGPTLVVTYRPQSGLRGDQTYTEIPLDDANALHVNVASGNLATEAKDLHIPGAGGLDLTIGRVHNSANPGDHNGVFGSGWTETINGGAFVNSRVWYDDARTIYADGGAAYRFDRDYANDAGSTMAYFPAPGLDAQLTADYDTGAATLTYTDGRVWTYAGSADGTRFTLSRIDDGDGHHIDLHPDSGDPYTLASLTDANDDTITLQHGVDGQLTQITDADSHTWTYTVDTTDDNDLLTAVEDPDDDTTTYSYATDPVDRLVQVTGTDGRTTDLDYAGERITTITRHVDGDPDHDRVWRFDYTPDGTTGEACDTVVSGHEVIGRTVVTDADDVQTTYCYDDRPIVVQTLQPEAAGPTSTSAPTIAGVARDGETLTASPGGWDGSAPITYAYQWQRCDAAGAGCEDLANATAGHYTLSSDDIGSTLKVVVTASNAAGSASEPSVVTDVVAAAPPGPGAPSNTVAPSVTGTPTAGRTLTGAVGTWTGTAPIYYSPQWQRCDATGNACVAIAGATRGTYRLVGADVGAKLRLAVTAGNVAGSVAAVSAPTDPIDGTAPANTVRPAVSGTAADGRTLTMGVGTWSGTAPINYTRQWQRCDVAGEDCADIEGAEASTYMPSADDIGTRLRVIVSAWNAVDEAVASSTTTAIVVASPPTVVRAPYLWADAPREGQWISVDSGGWEGSQPLTVTTHWEVCDAAGSPCTPVPLLDGIDMFRLGPDAVGSRIKAVVTAANAVDTVDEVLPLSDVVAAGPPAQYSPPTFTGTVQEGHVLTMLSSGAFVGTETITTSQRWERCVADWNCAEIPGATGTSYTLTADEVGKKVRLVTVGTNAVGSGTAVSTASGTVKPAVPMSATAPVVTGTARDGSTLTATPGTWTSSTTPTYAYSWRRCDVDGHACARIPQASLDHYELTTDDVGATIRVLVTASNAGGDTANPSLPTAVVASAAPSSKTAPAVVGELADTAKLTADPGTWTGSRPLTLAYAWQRCTTTAGTSCVAIPDATEKSYMLTPADVGFAVRVAVTAANDDGTATTTTAARGPVAALAPRAVGAAVLHGRPLSGETLALTPARWEGSAPLSHSYAWKRCDQDGASCTVVSGASGLTYTLSAADVGHRVVATDSASNASGSATANATATALVGVGAIPALELGFDEGRGTVAHDASPNDADATLEQARWTGGRHEGAITFDGETASATAPSVAALDGSALSIEAWVRVREVDREQVVAQRAGGGHQLTLLAAGVDGHVALTVDGSTIAGPVLRPDRWTHLAASAGPDGLRLLVDGESVAASGTAPSGLPSGGALRLGRDAAGTRHLDGALDDVRAYAAPLTAYQARADMLRAVAEQSPVAAYAFDEGDGTLAHDATGHGSDATLDDASWEEDDDRAMVTFDGLTGALTSAESDALAVDGAFTAEAAVRPGADAATDQVLLQQEGRGTSPGYTVYAADTTGHVAAVVGTTVLTGPELPVGAWSHVALAADGEAARLYVDGELVDEDAVAAAPRTLGVLHAATAADRPDRHLAGGVDDVRVYARALSEDEVGEDTDIAVEEDLLVPEITVGGTIPARPTLRFGESGSLRVTAVERDADGGWTPGVTRVSVYLEDELLAHADAPCDGGSCSLSTTARIDVDAPEWSSDPAHQNPYPDGDYDLRVVAIDAAGESTTTTVPVTFAVQALPPNDGIYVHASGSAAELSWNPNPDSAVVGYAFRYLDTTFNQSTTYPMFTFDAPVAKPFVKLTRNMWPGNTYTFWVLSRFSQWTWTGPVTEKHPVTATMPTSGNGAVHPPDSVTGHQDGEGRVVLDWPLTVRSDDPDQAVDGYLVFRDDEDGDPERLTPIPVEGTRFVDEEAPKYSTLHYEVRAVVGHLMSQEASTDLTTAAAGADDGGPAPHQDPSLTLGGSAVSAAEVPLTSGTRTLSYAAAAHDGASIAKVTVKLDGVLVHSATGCATADCTASGEYVLDNDLVTEGRHVLTVRAEDTEEASSTSRLQVVTDHGPPPAVTGVHSTVTRDGVRVAWATNPEWEETKGDIRAYEIARASSVDGTYTTLTASDPVSEASFVDTTAPAAGYVYYKVRAIDEAGNAGAYSDPVEASRVGTAVLAPTGLEASSEPYRVHLEWTPVAAFDFDHYVVYRAEGTGDLEPLGLRPDGASFDDSDVVPGRAYRYVVTAVSSDGEDSPQSAPVVAAAAGLAEPSAGAFAYLYQNNPHEEPQADWCYPDENDPDPELEFCGVSDYPAQMADLSVFARSATGAVSETCPGDCASTYGDGWPVTPSVSPDGKLVAYIVVGEDNRSVVHVARRDGTQDRQLCDSDPGPGSCLDTWPDTSPEAQACPTPEQCFTLPRTTAGALSPVFSPDGDTVYYGGNGLYAVPASGTGEPEKLMAVAAGERVGNPRPTADGKRIFFDLLTDYAPKPYEVAVDGTDRQPVVLPRVAAVDDAAAHGLGGPTPWSVFVNGGNHVAPSPDGLRIAYASGNGELVVADRDGGHARWLATVGDTPPAWSQDGSTLIYSDGSERAIRAVDVATGAQTTLVDADGDDFPVAVGGQTGNEPPTVTSPDLEGDGRYDKGDGPVRVRVRARSASGVRAVGVVVDGRQDVEQASCSPACPATFAAELTVDASGLAEGRHVVDVVAIGATGAETVVKRELIVDRTPPSAPTHVAATSEEDAVTVEWSEGVDPYLPGGAPGSSVQSEVRARGADDEWTAWTVVDGERWTVDAAEEVEVRSRDAAGNVSGAVSQLVVARGVGSCPIPQPGTVGPFIVTTLSCDDLDESEGEFDGATLPGMRTRIPLVGRDERKGKQEDCDEEEVASVAAVGSGVSRQEELKEECSYACDEEMIKELKRAKKDVNRYCRKRTWYMIYRIIPRWRATILDYDRITYVGITKDYKRRQCEHQGKGKRFPVGQFQYECLVEVPYYGVARAVEQALIDMYGFVNPNKNINLDHPDKGPQQYGIHSHSPPTLVNKQNSIYPGRQLWRLYCAGRVAGQVFLALNVPPTVPKGNRNKAWEANFPHRDCSHWWDLRKENGGSGGGGDS